MVGSIMPVDDTILPRRYQEEIFARAQEGNIIAALDTGSGKTFISTMLMKWIAARHADEKKIVFLVPKVALVEQQADFIARQTPLRVNRFHGAMSIEMTDRSKWRKEFEATDVLVITAQIFLNIITHSHWSMDKISLMIFDECHHCRKNHAYNGIMREYYQAQPGHRPKIFGMTASPIWNPKDAAESLATLERNMNAKVIAVREHAEELSEHLPKPNEMIVQYGRPARSYPSYPGKLIFDQLRSINIPTDWSIPWDRIESRYEVTKHSLGVFGAEYYLYAELRFRIGQLFTSADEATKLNMDVMLMAYSLPDYDTMVAPEFVPPSAEILELDALLSRYTPLFGDVADATISTIDVQLEWCTPQVQELVKVLAERYTPSFQGIVFVEQRHVALALAKILPRLVTTKRIIRCAELVGHGASAATKAKIKGMAIQSQQDVVKQFRDGELNLLIATSVAEEGLDFPACDVVIRFDPIQHMVGYVQSRGRARQKTSTFIVMVQEGQQEALARYMAFAETEPQLKQYYQRQAVTQPIVDDELEEGEVEPDDPVDIAHRERYVVERTKATLTYHSAIGLLNHLCSLIPRDRFTPPQIPVYTGDFRSVLQLPSSLPLPPKYLTFEGPMRNSKKEAKRAVAFHAVKSLHQIGVFDDYLLPTRTAQEGDLEDAEGQFISDWGYIPELMSVNVRDPWTVDEKMWSHVIYVDEKPVAGLVTGTRLYEADLIWNTQHIRIGSAKRVVLEAPSLQRDIMHTYTRIGVCWSVTGRGVKLPFSCYLVPLTLELKPDWDTMEKTNEHPWGSPEWENIGEESYGHLLCMNNKEQGKPMLLRAIRHDLSPMSRPPPGSNEAEFATYRDYWISAYTRKGIPPEIPVDGPLVEAVGLTRQVSGAYSLTPDMEANDDTPVYTGKVYLFPLSLARQMCMPLRMWSAFKLLPRILHRVTDVYRAHCARAELMLPSLPADLIIESYTLPSVGSATNNQRLETLGDSVLKLGIVVQLYNRFPHRHEGQLDILRRSSVSNKTLLSRACDVDLARFLSGEPETMRAWRHVLPEDMDWQREPRANRYAPRHIARNSMSDCMESSLGAAFVTGGIDCALKMATTLNLALGGPIPWSLRYSRPPEPSPRSALFTELQRDRLQYAFHREELLLEALTHPSFKTDSNSSYQRLEFLGDALIDLVVMDYLYRKFPNADSGQLSWARSRAVCGPTLAFLAVQKLQLHKLLLVNNVELSIAISRYVPILQDISVNEIIIRGWKQDPPKALSDAFESTLGAILVDCAWNYHAAAATIEHVMADVLDVLTPDLPKDPVSEFMTWGARAGCQQIRFDKKTSAGDLRRSSEGISVVVHDTVVVGPLGGSNLSLAKGLAAERARIELDNPKGKFFLGKICTCHRVIKVEETSEDVKDGIYVDSAPALVNGDRNIGETKAGLAGGLNNGAKAHLAAMISPKVEHDTIVTKTPMIGYESATHMRMTQVDLDGDVNMDDDWSASSGFE